MGFALGMLHLDFADKNPGNRSQSQTNSLDELRPKRFLSCQLLPASSVAAQMFFKKTAQPLAPAERESVIPTDHVAFAPACC